MTGNHVLLWALATPLLCNEGVAGDSLGRQAPQGQEIQLAQRKLEQPGPDHALERENAVKDLLGMKALEAHRFLQNRLRSGADSDGVSLYILGELRRSVSNPNDPVFGHDNGDAGRALIKSYVPSLVSAFIEGVSEQEKYDALRQPALACLRQMAAKERKEGLEAILEDGGIQELEMRKAALRAAAQCREVGLAEVIAEALDNDQLRATARQALEQLTYQVFRDRVAFQSWWENNKQRTYLELVEEMAREADASQAALQGELIQSRVQLVEAWVGQKDAVKWRDIHDLVLSDHPPGLAMACLQRLRAILADDPHEGNASEQRLEFHSALVQRLATAADDEEKALLLETAAYLIRPTEQAQRTAMETLLTEHLQSPNAILRLAALNGLRRFPSVANRAAVVQVAADALAAAGGEEEQTLRTALATLHGNKDWDAPAPEDPDHAIWLRVLRQVFTQFDDTDLLSEGLDVALLEDASGAQVPEVFDLLLDLVESQTDINLRLKVLAQLPATADEDNADRYVATVLARLDDESSLIRARAAEMLRALPATTPEQREEWDEQVLDKLRERLMQESSVDVFKALLAGLSELGSRGPQENVVSIFLGAIDALPESSVEHRMLVIEQLTQLGLNNNLDVGLWQLIASALLEQGQRDEALSILTQQKAGELASRSEVQPDDVQDGLDLLIQAALLKPAGDPPHTEDEARQALAAFAKLESDFNQRKIEAPYLLLRLELYDVVADHAALIAQGGKNLQEDAQALSPEQREQVLILMARASLGQQAAEEAWMTLGRLGEQGKQGPAALDVAHEIASALMPDNANLAVQVLTHVVEHTREDTAQFRIRFLDLASAKLTASTSSRSEVHQMLLDKQSIFASTECPQQVRERYDDLLKRAGN